MMRLWRLFGTAALAAAAGMFVASASAQVLNSAASPIALRAVLPESLTLTLSGNAVNFNLVAGSPNNPGSTPITATTNWVLKRGVGVVTVYAFFASSTSALTDGVGDNIPSADFQISDNGGAFRSLNRTVPFGGAKAGLALARSFVRGNYRGTRSDVMKFNINLRPLPTLPADSYTGMLTIQAQAF